MHLQISRLGRPGLNIPRKEFSEMVAESASKKSYVAERIRAHECSWIRHRAIPMSKQDLHAKTPCMLENDCTLKAMEEYMTRAGELGSSQKAVSDYWSSLFRCRRKRRHIGGQSSSNRERTIGRHGTQVDMPQRLSLEGSGRNTVIVWGE
jgi:hypothetical protein